MQCNECGLDDALYDLRIIEIESLTAQLAEVSEERDRLHKLCTERGIELINIGQERDELKERVYKLNRQLADVIIDDKSAFELLNSNDRYRTALEQISESDELAQHIAREALAGKEEG